MIVTCPNCTTRLQLDKAKVPSRPFSVRCPKCQQIINAQPPAPQSQRSAAFVRHEMSAMRMPERRRVVFVQLTDKVRTGDAHAAFLAGANLFVNTAEVEELPRALEKNIRDLNELYRDFNKALSLTEL